MKRLITTSLAIVFLAAAGDADAAACKFRQNKVDDFTGEQLVKTEWFDMTTWASNTFHRTIGNRKDLEVSGSIEGSQAFLKFRLKLSNAVSQRPREIEVAGAFFVWQGAGLGMDLADGSNVDLTAYREVSGKSRVKYDDGWYVVTSKATIHYRLVELHADALMKQDVTYMRLAAQGRKFEFVNEQGMIEFNVNKKGNEAINNVIGCLQQAQREGTT